MLRTWLPLSLSWQTTATATSYGYMVSTASNFVSTVVNGVGLSIPSAGLSGLAPAIYYWEANAANSGGNSLWSSVWSFNTLPATPPSAPVLSSPSNNATGTALS